METKQHADNHALDPDPIAKPPGSHPVGTGVGEATGAAAGALLGTAAGPVGIAVGAAMGAVAGGLVGKEIANQFDSAVEETYWRKTYATRPYITPGMPYNDYGPAYQHGWESRLRHTGKSFDEVEKDLELHWERAKGLSRLKWDQARAASRDAWERITHRNG